MNSPAITKKGLFRRQTCLGLSLIMHKIGAQDGIFKSRFLMFLLAAGCPILPAAHAGWAGEWKLEPPAVWSVSDAGGLELDSSLRQPSFNGSFSADRNFKLPPNASEGLWRLSAWVRSSGVHGLPHQPVLRIMLHGHLGLREQLLTYSPNKDWTYLETLFQPTVGEESAKLVMSSQVKRGQVSVRDIRLEPVSDAGEKMISLEGREGTLPWRSENRRFRVQGEIDPVIAGAPVWADIDFNRLMLAAGVKAPVDPSSVEVFGIGADGESILCPSAFNQPIGSLADDYERNGLVKWSAIEGAKHYEIYFSPADSAGAKPKEDAFLGVGEVLSYPQKSESPLWAGWPGKAVYPFDVDRDGTLDLVVESNDGGWWVARNIGTQDNPLFLPRARFLDTDQRPSRKLLSGVFADWNGDGKDEKITIKKTRGGNYVQGVTAVLVVEAEGRPPVELRNEDGSPLIFDDATWLRVAAGDVDGDGMPELIVGASDNRLRVLKRNPEDPSRVDVSYIHFNTFENRPTEAPDFAFSPTIVDWNGNGLNDLVTTSWSGECRLFLNQGNGDFSAPILLQQSGGVVVVSDTATPAVADWDGDGLNDLLLGDVSGRITWIRNVGDAQNPEWSYRGYLRHANGDPIYLVPGENKEAVQGRPEQFMGYSSALAIDIDGDGDLDLVVNDAQGNLSWIENQGTRTSPKLADQITPIEFDGQPVKTPWRNAPAAADWDGDGFPELVVLDQEGQLSRLTLSQTQPGRVVRIETLELASGGPAVINAPHGIGGPNLRALGATGRSNLAVGDMNNNGVMDILIGFSRDVMGGGNLLFCKNVGTNKEPRFEVEPFRTGGGRFVEWTGSEGRDQSHNGAPFLHDWNGDGKVELFHGVETGRVAYYDNRYLNLAAFPVFQWLEFAELKNERPVLLIEHSNLPDSLPVDLAQSQFPIQWLPLEAELKNSEVRKIARTVSVASPHLDEKLSGAFPIEAKVTGMGVITVDFFLNGELLDTERSAPYIVYGDDAVWDSTTVPDGNHELTIRATYFDGEVLVAKRVLAVSNHAELSK